MRLFEVIWSLKIFETLYLDESIKFRSWFKPSDEIIFLNTSENIGFRANKSHGLVIPDSWFSKFTNDAPYLNLEKAKENLPGELIEFLRQNHQFSLSAIRYFGLCLNCGYSVKQIKKYFEFNDSALSLQNDLNNWEPTIAHGSYLVLCDEAGYNRSAALNRRWNENNFLEIAEKAYTEHKLISVIIGADKKGILPKNVSYLLDLRQKLTFMQVAQLMKFSRGFIGNDSGPLHLANLMKVPSACIYLATEPETHAPIFPQLNIPIIKPESSSEAWEKINQMFV